MKCFLGIPNFLEEKSSLSHFIVFLYFFALITEEDFLISLLFFGTLHSNGHIFPFLLCFSLLFFSQLFICKASSGSHFAFCISFSWVWGSSSKPLPLLIYLRKRLVIFFKLEWISWLSIFMMNSEASLWLREQCRRPEFDPWVRKSPWRRKWLPAPVFLSGEFHGQRSLAQNDELSF